MNTIKYPKINNWKELVEQFGLKTPIGKNYKTAVDISRDLTFANNLLDLNDKREQPRPTQREGVLTYVAKEANEMSCVMINCEKCNFDSATCVFELLRTEQDGTRVYDYNGTAK